MDDPGNALTTFIIFVVVGGPILLGAAFAYALMRRRKRARTQTDVEITRERWGQVEQK